MIVKHLNPATGKEDFADLTGVVRDRANHVRTFVYPNFQGEKVEGMAVSLMIPVEIGGETEDIPVDVACFVEDEFPKILKLKLKPGMPVFVKNAKIDEQGRYNIDKASKIRPHKNI